MTTPDYLERFGPNSELTEAEIELIAVMRPELDALTLVSGRSRRKKKLDDLGPDARQLSGRLNQFGASAYRQGMVQEALASFALGLRCRLQFSDLRDHDTLSMLRHWGLAARDAGEFHEALDALEFVAEIWRKGRRKDAEAFDARNDVAAILLDLGDYRRAVSVLRTLINQKIRASESDVPDPQILMLQSNLADAIKMSGDFRAAHALAERVWRERQSSPELGPDHPDTLSSANNVAELLLNLGDLNGALRLQQDVLDRRRATQPEHPDTVTAAANLAKTLYDLGEWRRAADIERDVLRQRLTNPGPKHPDTLTAANNLAGSLRELGEFSEAVELLEWVVRERRKQLGLLHPATLSAMTNLAGDLEKDGHLAAASRMAKRAWQAQEQRTSAKHHETLTALESYAAIRFAQGKHKEAVEYQRRVLALRRRSAGREHVATLSVAYNLATMLSARGSNAEARKILEQTEVDVTRALGPNHPDTIKVRLGLANVYHSLENKADALRLVKDLLEQFRTRDSLAGSDFSPVSQIAQLLFTLDARETMRDLFPRLSASMWTGMEILNVDSSHRLLPEFETLHDVWLRYALSYAIDELPLALAALHGIESAAWVQVELGKQEGAKTPGQDAPRQRYAEARQALSDVRIQLQQIDGELGALAGAGEPAVSRPVLPIGYVKQLRSRQKEASALERDRMKAFMQARDALAQHDPAWRFSHGAASMRVSGIQERLHEGEAAVMLIPLSDLSCSALVVRRSQYNVVPLPELETLRAEFTAYEMGYRENSREFVLRDSADSDAPDLSTDSLSGLRTAPKNLSDLQQRVLRIFWRPLEQAVSGIEKLHVVYAPSFRGVGLHLGAEGLQCGFYPSLPGFFRVFELTRVNRRPAREEPSPVDVGFDCAWGARSPIPFSKAEALLIRTLVPQAKIHAGSDFAGRLRSGARARTVHLACHGATFGAQDRQHSVLLLDWESDSLLEPADVSSLPGEIDEFVCSTCVGGVVSRRAAVDAIGIVSALQLKGAHSIVACLAPAPDYYMPLLVGLYWYERLRGILPTLALERAKQNLLSAQWPDAVSSAVRSSYATVMEEILAHGQYAGAPTDEQGATVNRNFRLAHSVGSWTLPEVLRREISEQRGAMTFQEHRRFSSKWCESVNRRREFASMASNYLVEGRFEWVEERRSQLEHLCAFTQCFGGLSTYSGITPLNPRL